jgi:hypothetical protein
MQILIDPKNYNFKIYKKIDYIKLIEFFQKLNKAKIKIKPKEANKKYLNLNFQEI